MRKNVVQYFVAAVKGTRLKRSQLSEDREKDAVVQQWLEYI